MCASAAALGPGCRSAAAQMDEGAFTIVVLPDTQYYARSYPEILDAQINWIVRERQRARIVLVAHEGDIIDDDTDEAQWGRAAASLHGLDDVVPYLLSIGNHDYRRTGRYIDRTTSIDSYFWPLAAGDGVAAAGAFQPGHVENSYIVVQTPGGPWLVLSVEFGPRDNVLAWANGILETYPSTPAVLLTHAYLDADGSRYDHVGRRDQPWNPHRYFAPDGSGGVNDGEEMWRKLVSRHSNLMFVICGHALDDGTGLLTSRRPDGSQVHQILANFQTGLLGGAGYLRIMRFSPKDRSVAIQTYSPYLNRFKRDPDNEFELTYDPSNRQHQPTPSKDRRQ